MPNELELMRNAIALAGLSEEETGHSLFFATRSILNRLLVQILRTCLKPNYVADSVIPKVSSYPFAA